MRDLMVGVVAVAFSVLPTAGQTSPRTADAHPDLQGLWSNETLTPLERPRDLAAKEFFTTEEAAAYEKKIVQNRIDDPNDGEGNVADPKVWWERATKLGANRRTSLIVDPPDGRVPALTPTAQKRMAEQRAAARLHPADGPTDRSLQERCILSPTTGPPMLPGPYNNNYQIVQTRDYVTITVEMIHETRIIAMDGRPHLPQTMRKWLGDSIGHWDGDTLVVDTTNFTDQTKFEGSSPDLHVIERFKRVDANTILYRATIDDPSTFTKIWTVEYPFRATSGPVYEYACHEGNYAMTDIMGGARKAEAGAGKK
jgi:hypothetical protein